MADELMFNSWTVGPDTSVSAESVMATIDRCRDWYARIVKIRVGSTVAGSLRDYKINGSPISAHWGVPIEVDLSLGHDAVEVEWKPSRAPAGHLHNP